MKRKRIKYSYNERKAYHDGVMQRFLHSCSGLGFNKTEERLSREPKVQYSDGYTTFTSDIQRGFVQSEDYVSKQSLAFQRGFKAAKSAYEKSRNIKF